MGKSSNEADHQSCIEDDDFECWVPLDLEKQLSSTIEEQLNQFKSSVRQQAAELQANVERSIWELVSDQPPDSIQKLANKVNLLVSVMEKFGKDDDDQWMEIIGRRKVDQRLMEKIGELEGKVVLLMEKMKEKQSEFELDQKEMVARLKTKERELEEARRRYEKRIEEELEQAQSDLNHYKLVEAMVEKLSKVFVSKEKEKKKKEREEAYKSSAHQQLSFPYGDEMMKAKGKEELAKKISSTFEKQNQPFQFLSLDQAEKRFKDYTSNKLQFNIGLQPSPPAIKPLPLPQQKQHPEIRMRRANTTNN